MANKTLKDLTIKDNFLFAATMLEHDNCKRLLEMVLQTRIHEIRVIYEKSIIYHPEYTRNKR